mmetsp:Transcript_53381/g.103274  ORF Transcript_53381/g.103274 Transcript_53381/m.103274 type:complete len:623 (-) Transcript_53381:729-2597(-)
MQFFDLPWRKVTAPPPIVDTASMESESELALEPVRYTRTRSLMTGGQAYTALATIPREGFRQPRIPQLMRAAGITAAAVLVLAALTSGAIAGPRLIASWSHRGSSEFLQQSWQLECANNGDNCWESRCCKDASKTCFAHSKGWAQCGSQCSRDAQGVGQDAWLCAVLRPKVQCSAAYKNCTSSLCCQDPKQRCYYKDPGWASCKSSCMPNSIDPSEAPQLQTPWSCVLAGESQPVATPAPQKQVQSKTQRPQVPSLPTTPSLPSLPELPGLPQPGDRSAAPQQLGNCSETYGNCKESQCCMEAGNGCHKRDNDWYECREDCPHDKKWACSTLLEILQPANLASGSNSSALPVPSWSASTPAPHARTAVTLAPAPAAPVPMPPAPAAAVKVYCFSLMLPHGDEEILMRAQLKQQVGIFSCDGYTVLSNETIELSPPPTAIETVVMPGSLKCGFGGEYNTALNSRIFVRVWHKIIYLRRFLEFEWTVKLDPDCVFLPWRLQAHVLSRNAGDILYLNNCDEGLHGPIEVIAQGGMKAFALGFDRCKDTLAPEVGDYGEDVWLRKCMGLLGVARKDDFRLLTEKACRPYKDPVPCHSGAAAFHPLKTPSLYFTCLKQATTDGQAWG